MTTWSQGFWAEGFWAEGFWEGLGQTDVLQRPSGGGDSTHWRSPPRKARKRRKGDKDQPSENVIADAAIELPTAPDRPLPAAIAALLDVVAPQSRRVTPAAAPQLDVKRRAKARSPGAAKTIAEPVAVEPPMMAAAEDPAVTAERERRERLYQIALADDEWLMTVI